MSVGIEEVLAFHDAVSRKRAALTEKYSLPAVTFTLNIAGEKKRSILSDFVYKAELKKAEAVLKNPVCEDRIETPAGICSFFVLKEKAAVLKEECKALEDEKNGRLFDFDVTDENGAFLSRETPRKCLICERPAKECGRNRSHPLSEIERKTDEILSGFASEYLGERAKTALLRELSLTPKPGLVDRNGSGAHSDMDFGLFEKSVDAIAPFFEKAVMNGFSGGGIKELEKLGIEAENAMFAATNGINTHKGAVFLFLLLLSAYGKCLKNSGNVLSEASAIAEMKELPDDTHGALIRERYGKVGAVYEAKNGFPLAVLGAKALENGESELKTLFEIMSLCDDSTLLYRGGKEALDFVKTSAAKALSLSEKELQKESERLDVEFIKRGISPGGSADILALSFFLSGMEKDFGK